MTPVRLEPAALRSRVKHSTTEPLRSLRGKDCLLWLHIVYVDYVYFYVEVYVFSVDQMRREATI